MSMKEGRGEGKGKGVEWWQQLCNYNICCYYLPDVIGDLKFWIEIFFSSLETKSHGIHFEEICAGISWRCDVTGR